VPEEWERAERNRSSAVQLAQILCTVASVLIFIAGAVAGIVRWSRGRFASGTFAISLVMLVTLGLIGIANRWPSIAAQFSSAQPFRVQAAMVLAGSLLAIVAIATGVALAIGMAHRWVVPQSGTLTGIDLAAGAGLGVAAAGIAAVASHAVEPLDPTWPPLAAAAAVSPLAAGALDPIFSWIVGSALLLLIVAAADRLSAGWTRRRAPAAVALVLAGLVVAGSDGGASVARLLAGGVAAGIVLVLAYALVLRRSVALLPVAAAAMAFVSTLRAGALRGYPTALAGAVAAAILILLIGALWSRRLASDSRATAPMGEA
jgi:hypothetical protein